MRNDTEIFPHIGMNYQVEKECDEDLIEFTNTAFVLGKHGYEQATEVSGNIKFKSPEDAWRSRLDHFRKLERGEVVIAQHETACSLTLTYHVSFTFEVFIVLVSALIAYSNGFGFVMLALPFLIQLYVRISTLKRVANKLLDEIVACKSQGTEP